MPPTIVIFGATGDLAREKLFPALMRLYHDGGMPKDARVVGFSRRTWNDVEFHAHLEPYLQKLGTPTEISSFLKSVKYHQGNFDDVKSYDALAQKITGPILLYLSIGPDNFKTVIETLKKSKLHEVFNNKDSKILIEKPFGLSSESAQVLDEELLGVCSEEQIYRVDHYLAKAQVMNILNLKLTSPTFGALFDATKLASVHVRLFEDKDIGTRGPSYDKVGALTDVGQNHLLQILATLLATPASADHEEVRRARAEVLTNLMFEDIVCGQYQGYRGHDGVSATSETETYFKLLLQSHLPAHAGIDIVLESGKAMGRAVTDISLTLKDGSHKMIEIQPHVVSEGFTDDIAKELHKNSGEAYEKLFADALEHNDELFPSLEEIVAAWAVIDEAKKVNKLSEVRIYPKGSLHI